MYKTKTISRALVLLLFVSSMLILSSCAKKEDVSIAQMNAFIAEQNIDKSTTGWKTSLTMPPKLKFSEGKKYFWKLETSKGNIVIEFIHDEAPMHVSSTIYLTKLGFYDDIVFHRVITGFMAQSGDPLGNGRGGPGYKYAGEYEGKAKHDKAGILSMANAGPNTDGSQFFLTFKATPHLNGRHTVFGTIVEGLDVLKTIEDQGSPRGKPKEEMKIIKATISVE